MTDALFAQPLAAPFLKLCLRRALVEVALRHEDGEGDVVDVNVLPRGVLREALAADLRPEPRSVVGINDRDLFEVDVRQLCV